MKKYENVNGGDKRRRGFETRITKNIRRKSVLFNFIAGALSLVYSSPVSIKV